MIKTTASFPTAEEITRWNKGNEQVEDFEDFRTNSPVARRKLSNLRRKEDNRDKNSEEEDAYTTTSESSYSSDLDEEIREEMGLKDREIALYNALQKLARGDIRGFLKDEYTKQLFRTSYALIESCGRGAKTNSTLKLWTLAWYDRLQYKKSSHTYMKQECVSCAEKRNLSYSFRDKETGDDLGRMGEACYNIRFDRLMDVIRATKKAARTMVKRHLQPGTAEFEELVIDPIVQANDEVIEAAEEMSKYRPKRR